MAGGASADPPPFWLIIITLAVFLGFILVAPANTLPSVNFSTFTCTGTSLFLDCASSAISIVGQLLVLLGTILTLGGFQSFLPLLIQGPLLLFFALTWGIIIVKMITNTAGAVIP